MTRQQLYRKFNLKPPKLQLYQLTKNIAAKIVPYIYYAFRDLCVIFDKYIFSRIPILTGVHRADTAD